MNRIMMSVALLLISGSASYAEDLKPVRVIPITREAAEASAVVLAAAKNPTIGVPPQGQSLSQQAATRVSANGVSANGVQGGRHAGNERVKELRNVREARAEAVVTPAPESNRPTRSVNVISPTSYGDLAIRVYEVSSAP